MKDDSLISSSPISPMHPLSPTLRCALKARAHHLPPAVMLGQQGLTENILKAIEKYLINNELIKVRVLSADNEARTALAEQISQRLQAQLVQHIGRQLVFYRPLPKKKKQPEKKATPTARRARTSHASPSTRPQPKASFTHKHRTSRFSSR